jgi:hypothetical protein
LPILRIKPILTTMNRSLVTLLLCASVLAPGPLASAQEAKPGAVPECGTDAPVLWIRVVMGRLCRLTENPEIKKATGATDALTLLGAVPNDVLWRLSDTELLTFYGVFARSLEPLSPGMCASLYPGKSDMAWGEKVQGVAAAADSSLSEEWADLLESWIWAAVRKAPRQA